MDYEYEMVGDERRAVLTFVRTFVMVDADDETVDACVVTFGDDEFIVVRPNVGGMELVIAATWRART